MRNNMDLNARPETSARQRLQRSRTMSVAAAAVIVGACTASPAAAEVIVEDFESLPPYDPWNPYVNVVSDLRFRATQNGSPSFHRGGSNDGWASLDERLYDPNDVPPSFFAGTFGNRSLGTPWYDESRVNVNDVRWEVLTTTGAPFHFFGAWITSIWDNPEHLVVSGVRNGQQVFEFATSIATTPTWVSFGAEYEIDTLQFWRRNASVGSPHFIMDNFAYLPVPAPGALALLVGGATLGSRRRTHRR